MFSALAEAIKDAVLLLDSDGKIVYANPSAYGMFGYEDDELIGRNAHLLLAPTRYYEDYHNAYPHFAATGEGPVVGNTLELEAVKKDGTEFKMELSVSALRLNNEWHAVGVLRDISNRKIAEEKLQQAATIFNNTLEGIVVTDLDNHITDSNKSVTLITGYQHEELVGKTPRFLFEHGVKGEEAYKSVFEQLKQNGAWQGEVKGYDKQGRRENYWLSINRLLDDSGEAKSHILVFSSIKALKRSQGELEYLSYHDQVTKLPNRTHFNRLFNHAIEMSHIAHKRLGVLLLDLDRFKKINDSFGHSIGDEVLREVAIRVKSCLRATDIVARLYGDEFIILLESIVNIDDISIAADKVVKTFSSPFRIHGHEFYLTASIGVSIYPDDGDDANVLLRSADAALDEAKILGRNVFRRYTPELVTHTKKRLDMETALKHALEVDGLQLHYQPQVEIQSGRLVSVEALVRWPHPTEGLIPPTIFIPLAEEAGLIRELGRWVLKQACNDAKKWQANPELPDFIVAVNLSGLQLFQDDLAEVINEVVASTGISASMLELEITESFFIGYAKQTITILEQLKMTGVAIAIDDFGTGYSSLSYLKRLPVDKLKIDQSFVRELSSSADNQAIVRAIVALAHGLDMTAIAEGVETREQLEFLRGEGCDLAQGYIYSPPIPADTLTELVAGNTIIEPVKQNATLDDQNINRHINS